MGYNHSTKKTIGDHVYNIEEHIHAPDQCYPTLGAGQAVADGGAAWAEAVNPTQIIPAGTITQSFDVHFINVEGATAQGVFEISLWAGPNPGVLIARRRITIVQNVGNIIGLISYPTMTEVQNPGTRISGKVADNTGGITLTLSLQYHTY